MLQQQNNSTQKDSNNLQEKKQVTSTKPCNNTSINTQAGTHAITYRRHGYRFKSNSTYFTICIYGLVFVTLASIIIMSIVNFENTKAIYNSLTTTLSPFIIAFFIAYILNPFVRRTDRFLSKKIFKSNFPKARKLTAISFVYVIVISLIIVTLLYITPELINSTKDIQDALNKINVTELEANLSNSLDKLQTRYPFLELKSLQDKINEFIPSLFAYGTEIAASLVTLSVSIFKTIINVILAVVISVYMLSDKKVFTYHTKRVLYAFLPKRKANMLISTLKDCNLIFSNFIIGKSIDSLIIGIICFILMTLLGLRYAVLFSFIVGITNMIPYFGPFIGAIPGVLIYLFVSPLHSLLFALMIFILQQFDGLYLGPKILGESTGLTPLWVIFGITIGGAYAGILGMFLGVPITAVVAFILNRWISNRLSVKNITI